MAAMLAGTTSMVRRVALGDRPADVIPAYDTDPSRPAAPVPELHVDTQFLHKQISVLMLNSLQFSNPYTGVHIYGFTL